MKTEEHLPLNYPYLLMKRAHTFLFLLLTSGVGQAQDVNDFFSGNGSFELGPYVNPLTFSGGTNQGSSFEIPGWRMVAGGRSPEWIEGLGAQDGERYIRLSSQGGSSNLFSSARITGSEISHTPFTVGDLYELVFWAAGGVGNATANLLSISFGGNMPIQSIELPIYSQEEFEVLGGPVWTEYIIPFSAGVESSYLWMTALPINAGGSTSLYLDNVSFRAVPEPGSALLVLSAALGWLVVGRCRKHRRAD